MEDCHEEIALAALVAVAAALLSSISAQAAQCNLKMHTMTAPNPVQSGQTVSISLRVKNIGNLACQPTPFPGTGVGNVQPAGLVLAHVNPAIVQTGGTASWGCSWDVPSNDLHCGSQNPLPGGYQAVFTFQAHVAAAAGTNINDCATVSNQHDSDPSNNNDCKVIHVN